MAGETHHPIDLLTSWTEALLAEREDDRKRLSKVLSGSSLKVRRAEGLTWSPVEVVEASYAFGGAKWSLACKEGGGLPGIFRVGSAVLLTPIGDPKDVAEWGTWPARVMKSGLAPLAQARKRAPARSRQPPRAQGRASVLNKV